MAEGGALLRRYGGECLHRGFESLLLRLAELPRVRPSGLTLFRYWSGIGRGPVYPGLGGSGGHLNALLDTQYGGRWDGGKVFWYVLPSYRGRVLLRGHRLDGPQSLGFNGRRLPLRELRIQPTDTVSWQGQPLGSRGIPSGVRVLVSGCYGVQIDGAAFSRTVVFTVDAVSR